MTPKIKNIIIFVAIGAVLVLIYIFFINPAPDQGNLVSSNTVLPNVNTSGVDTSFPNGATSVTQDFLTLLLNVKNIKLDDTIFSDPAFNSLHDSSITLTLDGTEGRPNPFAQFGNDVVVIVPLTCILPQVLDTPTNTCIIPSTPPPVTCIPPKVLNISTNTCVNPPPTCILPQVLNISTNTCITPVTCKLPKVLNIATNTCVNLPPN